MKKLLLILSLFALLFVGCEGAADLVDPDTEPIAISIDGEGSIEIEPNANPTLTATIEGDVQSESSVVWSSSDQSVVKIDAASGEITTISAGEATITATLEESSDSVDVTVLFADASYVVISTEGAPDAPLISGATYQFEATIYDDDDDDTYVDQSKIAWNIYADDGDTGSTIESSTGLFTAGSDGYGLSSADVVVMASVYGATVTIDFQTIAVEVKKVDVISFSFESEYVVRKGVGYTIQPMVDPLNASDQSYAIAVVSGGEYIDIDPLTNVITGVTEGSASVTISPTEPGSGSTSFNCTITVVDIAEGYYYSSTTGKYASDYAALTDADGIVFKLDEDSSVVSIFHLNASSEIWANSGGYSALNESGSIGIGTTDVDGVVNMATVMAANEGWSSTIPFEHYPAFAYIHALNDYDEDYSGSQYDGVWFMPLFDDILVDLRAFASTYGVESINKLISDAGGDFVMPSLTSTLQADRFWTSVDNNGDNNANGKIRAGYGLISTTTNYQNKEEANWVLPILKLKY